MQLSLSVNVLFQGSFTDFSPSRQSYGEPQNTQEASSCGVYQIQLLQYTLKSIGEKKELLFVRPVETYSFFKLLQPIYMLLDFVFKNFGLHVSHSELSSFSDKKVKNTW